MRKFLLLIAVFSFAALGTVDAQKCSKSKLSCAKSKMTKKSTTTDATDVDAIAAKFASENENIERKVCEKSGKVSYFETKVCQYSGSKTVSEVAWDADNAKFVNVSPSDNAKKSCSKSKAACAKGAKATKASTSTKACCAKGSCTKACCAGKKASKEAKAVKASM